MTDHSQVSSMPPSDAFARLLTTVARGIAAGDFVHLAVVLTDMGGHICLAWRCPQIGFYYNDLATAKAWTAASLRRTPTATGKALQQSPAIAASLAGIGGGRFAPLPGSGLLMDSQNLPVCGAGIAGPDSAERDTRVLQEISQAAMLAVHVT